MESPQRREAMGTLLQKSDRRKLLLQLCGTTTTGCGLGTGRRRRSRHAQIKKITLLKINKKRSLITNSSFGYGRDDKIRTCGLFVPNEARYRAALHPVYLTWQRYNFYLKSDVLSQKKTIITSKFRGAREYNAP